MTYIVTGAGLTIEDIVAVARHGKKVELCPEAIQRIDKCRAMLEKKIEASEIPENKKDDTIAFLQSEMHKMQMEMARINMKVDEKT